MISSEYKKLQLMTTYRFYFADERRPDGEPVYSAINGPAHAEFYTQLAKTKTQGPWNATFVKEQGYVNFPEVIVQDAVDFTRI